MKMPPLMQLDRGWGTMDELDQYQALLAIQIASSVVLALVIGEIASVTLKLLALQIVNGEHSAEPSSARTMKHKG
jgi:hypothetical protein